MRVYPTSEPAFRWPDRLPRNLIREYNPSEKENPQLDIEECHDAFSDLILLLFLLS
jgi:hypothetical protein